MRHLAIAHPLYVRSDSRCDPDHRARRQCGLPDRAPARVTQRRSACRRRPASTMRSRSLSSPTGGSSSQETHPASTTVAPSGGGVSASPGTCRDGRLDPSFRRGGRVLTDVGGIGDAYAVVIQHDGKILVVGEGGSSLHTRPLLHRGTAFDSTFGRGGSADTRLRGGMPAGAACARSPVRRQYRRRRRTARAPQRTTRAAALMVSSLVRYSPNGRLDRELRKRWRQALITGFGSAISWTGTFGSSVAVQPDGRIVAARNETDDVKGCALALADTRRTEQLDSTFGTGGKMLDVVGAGPSLANYIAVQPDGKIVAAGETIVRYGPDGSRDASFGDEGQVPTALGFITGIFLRHDSTIVVAGGMESGALGVARYLPDGAPDRSFGRGGSVATNFGRRSNAWALDVAAQRDGKIVAAGTKEPSGDWPEFALARYTAQRTPRPQLRHGGEGHDRFPERRYRLRVLHGDANRANACSSAADELRDRNAGLSRLSRTAAEAAAPRHPGADRRKGQLRPRRGL